MVKLNLNDRVRVKLTDYGRKRLEKDHIEFWANRGRVMPYAAPAEDVEGWSHWQLWSLMSAVGPHVGLGLPMMIDVDGVEVEPSSTPAM